MGSLIEARGVQVHRSGRVILDLPEFSMDRGEILGIVGPNGSGKSTLVKVLALLEKPTLGFVSFRGFTAWDGDGGSRDVVKARRSMAVVFQNPTLLDGTVYDNVALPLRLRGIARREYHSRVVRWLEVFGISHLAGRHCRHLSGGEAQRTCLARAFIVEPEAMFLDEPFASLDLPAKRRLIDDLSQVLASSGAASIIVSHDVAEVSWFTRTVMVLRDGKILGTREIPHKMDLGVMDLWAC